MAPDELEILNFDLRKLDLPMHSRVNGYGFGRYYNGQDLLPPDDDL